ncbi:hypothetical protein BDZ90DRAFT_232091 [Jaminaea rosea]|uniref:HPP transmembrane region domain-containing protein n=1 Tax=Jaminaea rosea TaxID=1569628 RepID=A0A316UQV9_9BASI|nr:hypothetical protein BDZ90DRAFT_232091 [Jaminaea rosea]PWN27682.1 hypothetical protein BDZ90DRAFT_232091 [Jaminaea rosea]
MSSPPPQQAQTSLSSTATAAPGGSTTRWRSESRTVRGSYDGDDRSRSRSVKAFGRLRSSSRRPLSKARAPSAARSSPPGAGATQTAGDLEKGKGGAAGQPQARPPWYSRKFRSPLEPLLKKIPMWLEGYIWGWIGGTIGVGLVIIVFTRPTPFTDSIDVPQGAWTSPAIVGSFGASAVLLYGAPMSPLSQPRSFFFGQVLSALVGVIITKLFALNSHFQVDNTNHSWSLVWIAGGIATGTAILVQQVTRTIHPPGGATAVLAVTSPPIVHLGWRYVPVVMLTAAIMLVWAFLWINLGRRSWPVWWLFPPEDVRKATFPGPELGVYGRKAREAYRRRGGRKPSQQAILPVGGQRNDLEKAGVATAREMENGPAGSDAAVNVSEWQDQSAWKEEKELHSGANGRLAGEDAAAAAAAAASPAAPALRQVNEADEAETASEERQSRWARA